MLLPLAAIYLASLPHSVQILDSGELVTSAWDLTVPHAPGYPLYVWLYHAFMKIFGAGTVFFRAALLTALCCLGALALLLKLARSWLGVAAIAAMGTLGAVWRYAVLPDVFALNLVLGAALIVLAFAPPSARRTAGAAVVFGLGAANHHTIVFLSPLVVLIAWEEPKRWRALAALVAGAAISVGLYASLFLLDTGHVNSFGDLSTLRGLVRHFLRTDYGTFNLSTGGGTANIGRVALDLAVTVGAAGLAAVTIVGLGVAADWKTRTHRTWWVLLACVVAYLVLFLPRMNLGGDDTNAIGLRERFFLLPVLMLTALAVCSPLGGVKAQLHRALLLCLAAISLVQAVLGDTYGLAHDVVVQEYMRNLLKTAVSRGTPAILIVDSDTKTFGGRYVQSTEPGYEDVFILPRSRTFDRRLLERAKKRWPQLYYDAEVVKTQKNMDIFKQLLAPNMSSFSITHVMPFSSPRGMTTYYPVGRGLDPGTGIVIADAPAVKPTPPSYRADSSDYVDTKEIFAEYTVYYLALGNELLAKGDKRAARQAFLDGLGLVPYCVTCLRKACELEAPDPRRCDNAVNKILENEYDYFE